MCRASGHVAAWARYRGQRTASLRSLLLMQHADSASRLLWLCSASALLPKVRLPELRADRGSKISSFIDQQTSNEVSCGGHVLRLAAFAGLQNRQISINSEARSGTNHNSITPMHCCRLMEGSPYYIRPSTHLYSCYRLCRRRQMWR